MTRLLPGRVLALLGILLVALNVRTAVSSLSPIVDRVSADVPLDELGLGVIGMLPPVAFALAAIGAPVLARRVGLEAAMALACLADDRRPAHPRIRRLVRAPRRRECAWRSPAWAIGNVLLPPAVKKYFPDRIGVDHQRLRHAARGQHRDRRAPRRAGGGDGRMAPLAGRCGPPSRSWRWCRGSLLLLGRRRLPGDRRGAPGGRADRPGLAFRGRPIAGAAARRHRVHDVRDVRLAADAVRRARRSSPVEAGNLLALFSIVGLPMGPHRAGAGDHGSPTSAGSSGSGRREPGRVRGRRAASPPAR